jgi:hypothetical protein
MSEKEKSYQDLEKEKLEIEINFLNHNLEKDKNEFLRSKKPGEIIRKNISVLLAAISVVGAILGIILPLNNYFMERRKELLPKLNGEIIDLVKTLNDSSASEITQEDNTIMLTYYGMNAIPVLLSRLERSKNQAEANRLINAIKKIHEENSIGVTDKIFYSFKEQFNDDYTKPNIDDTDYSTNIYSYYQQLLTSLNLSKKEIRILNKLMRYFESEMPNHKNNKFIEYVTDDLNIICKSKSIDTISYRHE